MSISQTLKAYLDRERVHYDVLPHPEVFRAAEIAHRLHTPEKEMAKVVIVKLRERFMMTVLPARWHVDLHRLRTVFATHQLQLATEEEINGLFPDCELGAMPPFGNLYAMDVYVSEELARNKEIAFNAGSHVEVIRMAYVDFERLVEPKVLAFTT